MSQHAKQLERFLAIPADFLWEELVTLLAAYGFAERSKKGGSFRTFVSASGQKIFLHRPHPENVVPRYALRQVKGKLTEFGLIKVEEKNGR